MSAFTFLLVPSADTGKGVQYTNALVGVLHPTRPMKLINYEAYESDERESVESQDPQLWRRHL